jgi:hypothetical protein
MTTSRAFLLLLAGPVLPLGACAEYNVAKNDYEQGANAPSEDDVVSDYLRVDIYPSDQNPDLLPETHTLDEDWEGLELSMSSPVTFSGQVVGYDASPWFDVSVPGSTIPIEALLSVYEQGTIMGGSARTLPEEDGAFELRLPRSDDYTLTVVPVAPEQLPLLVDHLSVRADSSDELIELDYGAPVYGWVENSSGLPMSSLELELQLRDPITGATGPAVTPSDDGYFQLRALPGSAYDVVLSGASGKLVPTTSQEVLVESDEGAEVDFQIGVIQGVGVSGRVLTSGSAAVEGATARFTSLELFDYPGGELSLDDITNSRGEYRLVLLPGRYKAEFIAPASMELSPVQTTLEASDQGDGDDFDVELEGLYTIESQVLGPDGQALAGVTIVATERGFDGYTYTTTSDEGGNFTLEAPSVKLQFALEPSGGEASVTYIETPVEDFPPIIMLEHGDAISGTISHGDEPVAFALVEVRDSEDQLYATTLTDELGAFEVRVRWDGHPVDLPLDTASP